MKKILLIASILFVGAGCVNPSSEITAYEPPPSPIPTDLGLAIPPVPAPEPAPSNEPVTKEVMTPNEWKFPGVLPASEISGKQIRMETSKGTIVFELFEKEAPKTVSNFVYLTKGGYYDGLTFHRREEGFVIQGGDPSGNGTGGPGYKFADETVVRPYDHGIVAMANAGPDTNGSQFFIMLADYPLPPNYTIFGKVTSGLDAVAKIKVGDQMTKVTVEAKK